MTSPFIDINEYIFDLINFFEIKKINASKIENFQISSGYLTTKYSPKHLATRNRCRLVEMKLSVEDQQKINHVS